MKLFSAYFFLFVFQLSLVASLVKPLVDAGSIKLDNQEVIMLLEEMQTGEEEEGEIPNSKKSTEKEEVSEDPYDFEIFRLLLSSGNKEMYFQHVQLLIEDCPINLNTPPPEFLRA